MSTFREDAIQDFGPPNYQCAQRLGSFKAPTRSYWFYCMLMMDGDAMFRKLKVKKGWFTSNKSLYWLDSNGKWLKCEPNVQAKWEMHQVDRVILGDGDE